MKGGEKKERRRGRGHDAILLTLPTISPSPPFPSFHCSSFCMRQKSTWSCLFSITVIPFMGNERTQIFLRPFFSVSSDAELISLNGGKGGERGRVIKREREKKKRERKRKRERESNIVRKFQIFENIKKLSKEWIQENSNVNFQHYF